jgi:hypothetical protein
VARAGDRASNHDSNVLVESPKRLRDKDTGRLREHDVVLIFTQRHHEILMALECRDRSPPTDGPVTKRFVDRAPAFYVVDENGDRVGVRRLEITMTYEVTSELSPFMFREYVDRGEGRQLYTAAVAKLDCANLQGDIVMVHEEGRGAQVSFVPASRPAPQGSRARRS